MSLTISVDEHNPNNRDGGIIIMRNENICFLFAKYRLKFCLCVYELEVFISRISQGYVVFFYVHGFSENDAHGPFFVVFCCVGRPENNHKESWRTGRQLSARLQ